jgi:hypothetical protein
MKGMFAAVALAVAAMQPAFAEGPLASEAAVRELMQIAQIRELHEGTVGQMDAYMNEAMNRALAGRVPSPEQQAVLDDAKAKIIAAVQEELKWDVLEPQYVEIYRKSFTDEELNGILAFYRTSAGQAMIRKMPVVMKHSMDLMQDMVGRVTPKLREIQVEALQKLEQLEQAGAAPKPSGG